LAADPTKTAEWWKEKRKNNQYLLYAAEEGNLDEFIRLLDRS